MEYKNFLLKPFFMDIVLGSIHSLIEIETNIVQ